jgi:FYVE, RhoGEF and PH domain containing 5/6
MTSVPFPRPQELSSENHVEFPDITSKPGRVAHLPFRRMSLTSIRSSMDLSTPGLPAITQGQISSRAVAPSPPSSPQRPSRRSHPSSLARPTSDELLDFMSFTNVNDTQELRDKRRKVLNEFHDTERTYLQGLDLIYFVNHYHYVLSHQIANI